jgi:nicotinamide mononucleotide transporter
MIDLSGWFLKNYDEVAGTLIALAYLYFSIKQNIWLWPLGLISSAIFAYVFFRSKIYAGMGLQVYYVIISVYGWYNWWKVRNRNKLSTSVNSLLNNYKLIIILVLIVVFLFIILSQILIQTNTNVAYFDAFISALSIVATWMLAKKYIEHWWLWLLADPISIGIFIYQKLYFMIILYLVYTIMAFVGYKSWKKDLITA